MEDNMVSVNTLKNKKEWDVKVLIDSVNKALDVLYEKDHILIENNVEEECIVSVFTRYFERIMLEKKLLTPNISIDNEYNRDFLSESTYKKILYDDEYHIIKPDFIMHERGKNTNNILVIEFKKSSNRNESDRRIDHIKLSKLTDSKFNYEYILGLFIDLTPNRMDVVIKKYIDGQIVE